MIAFRIMRHSSRNGTSIATDRISNQDEAYQLCNVLSRGDEASHYYVLSYEEARHLPDMRKPHIKRIGRQWQCSSYRCTASAASVTGAYHEWERYSKC